ncbi:hypothetical protein RI367_002805 [Sorochytrium milnesiophthora]
MEETIAAQHDTELLAAPEIAQGAQTESGSGENAGSKLTAGLSGFGFSTSSWKFGSIIDTVKKQGTLLGELTKRDLNELYTAVTEESHLALNTISHGVQNLNLERVKNSVESAESAIEAAVKADKMGLVKRVGDFGGLVKSAVQAATQVAVAGGVASDMMGPDGIPVEQKVQSEQQNQQQQTPAASHVTIPILFEPMLGKKELYLLDPTTPTHPFLENGAPVPSAGAAAKEASPAATVERFEAYAQNFDIAHHKQSIEQILGQYADVRACREELVPAAESDNMFWLRFFWHLSEFQESEERKKRLLEDALKKAPQDEDFSWDADETTSPTAPASTSNEQVPASTPGAVEPAPPSAASLSTQVEKPKVGDATAAHTRASLESSRNGTEAEFDIVTDDDDGSVSRRVASLTSASSTPPPVPATSAPSDQAAESARAPQAAARADAPTPQPEEEDDWGEWE